MTTRTDFDDDADGTTDRTEFYTYGANGRVSQTDFDDDGDGTIDRIERALSSLDGTNGFILTGIDAGDNSGISVSSAGDVNGDGYDDLIIGAWLADPNGDNRAGETYVIYGGASAQGTDGVLDLEALDGSNGFILTGIDADDRSGFSVSSAGDVNGDGYDDLIIGAYLADPNGDINAGETYIVYGGANAPAQMACWICPIWMAVTASSSTGPMCIAIPVLPSRLRGMSMAMAMMIWSSGPGKPTRMVTVMLARPISSMAGRARRAGTAC